MEPLIWDLDAFGQGNEHAGEIRQMNHPEGIAADRACQSSHGFVDSNFILI